MVTENLYHVYSGGEREEDRCSERENEKRRVGRKRRETENKYT